MATTKPEALMTDLKDILARAQGSLILDAVGATALFVLLFAGLTLSGSA